MLPLSSTVWNKTKACYIIGWFYIKNNNCNIVLW